MYHVPEAVRASSPPRQCVEARVRNIERRDVLHLQARLATHSKSRHEIDVGAGNQPWNGELLGRLSFMPGFRVAY